MDIKVDGSFFLVAKNEHQKWHFHTEFTETISLREHFNILCKQMSFRLNGMWFLSFLWSKNLWEKSFMKLKYEDTNLFFYLEKNLFQREREREREHACLREFLTIPVSLLVTECCLRQNSGLAGIVRILLIIFPYYRNDDSRNVIITR